MFRKWIMFGFWFILSFSGSLAHADLAAIEEAILHEDYELVRQLAEEVLNFPVVEKTIANHTYYYLALSHLRRGDQKEAQKIFKVLLKKDMDEDLNHKSYLGLTEAYFMSGDYKRARNLMQKALKEFRKSPYRGQMYLKLAQANLKLAQWKEAKEILYKIIRTYPESFEAYTAKQLLEERQYFAVQVGAFLDRKRAENLVSKLQNQKEYAYIVETQNQDLSIFYRVRVGQLSRLGEAQKLQKKLSREGFPTQIYP